MSRGLQVASQVAVIVIAAILVGLIFVWQSCVSHVREGMREHDEKRWAAERVVKEREAAELAERQSYFKHVALKDLRGDLGTRFGRDELGVFGTIVNQGDRELRRVRILVHFLNGSSARIGKTEISIDMRAVERPPGLPAYACEFGRSVEGEAPRGWSGDVEGEVVGLDFADQ